MNLLRATPLGAAPTGDGAGEPCPLDAENRFARGPGAYAVSSGQKGGGFAVRVVASHFKNALGSKFRHGVSLSSHGEPFGYRARNVAPPMATNSRTHHRPCYSELLSQLPKPHGSSRETFSDFGHAHVGQFRLAVVFASNFGLVRLNLSWPPALFHHVSNIVPARPEEEVVGSYAWRVVATVADPEAAGDVSVGQHPRDAVCPPIPWRHPRLPITGRHARPRPNPTASPLANARPKILRIGRRGTAPPLHLSPPAAHSLKQRTRLHNRHVGGLVHNEPARQQP